MTEKTSRLEATIRKHPIHDRFYRAIVTTCSGRCYYCDWAEVNPSEETVREGFRSDRRAFQAYDCCR